MNNLSLVLAQINPVVGDIPGNTQRIIAAVEEAREQFSAQLVIFPELVLCGYPPEDLLLRPSMQTRIERALAELSEACVDMTVVIGYPWREGTALYNMAGVIQNGKLIYQYAKNLLPNYQVFDEKRYFEAGTTAGIVEILGIKTALTVCEDIWDAVL